MWPTGEPNEVRVEVYGDHVKLLGFSAHGQFGLDMYWRASLRLAWLLIRAAFRAWRDR